MTMKKKLTVTTLAASIMFASIAGLPLSEQGLANKLGITVGVASAATPSIQDKLNGLRDELARDTQGLEAARATRDFVELHEFSDVEMETLLGPIWTNLSPAGVDVTPVFELFNSLDLFYDESSNAIEQLLSEPAIRDAIDLLFTYEADGYERLPGIDESGGLSKQSVIDFQETALTALKDNKMKLLLIIKDAFETGGSSQAIKDELNEIVSNNVLNQQNLIISKFLNKYGITLSDLNQVQNNIANFIGEDAKLARTAIESAGIRYLLKDEFTYAPVVTSSSVEPKLTIFGYPLNPYLNWELVSGSGVKFESGKLLLDGANSGSGVIQARDSKFKLLLYISPTLTLTKTDDSNTTGGGGSPVTTNDETTKKLNALKDQLANASEEKKQEIFRKAQEIVADAIRELATLDLQSLIKVESDTAKPTLNVTELASKMKEIAAQAKDLNYQLKQLNPNAAVEKIQLKLDFGSISAKTTEIPLGKALLDAAIANGVETVAISMNGLTLGVSPTEFGADATLKVTSQDTKVATSATQLPVAAGVYEFEFTSGGANISNFNTPVEVTIPVPNGSKFDTELLSLAKIVDGKLEFYGGSYENGVLNAQRTGFSTYTVVENKVEFGDTTSVKAWAGRQIQVAAAKGILEGRADQFFVPNGLVTRAEFAKMIVKTFSLENVTATENFTDVNDSDWFKVYVASAVKNGIVNGKEASKFDPNGNITRAEMAVMSSRALALKGISLSPAKVDEALQGFTDVNAINSSLKAGVALAASEGIVIGEEGNVFNPNANSTRAQAAVVIYRLLNK
ncbi:S-layer homology domain-containing protein [Paenibacillus qinlingensis]|uniref:S-layer homology domain-containing protein n=1 Tax=Paenibacillus qinlingensis TaxID=1837343 RepID=UPI0015652966|nr:S-layer homology domain-containing protein [Paenibacillus qinlingensis]NQX59443.1 S-layer homology domain-containing protein [Paenibacillus qinlingensis]